MIHIFLHIAVPAVVARLVWRRIWLKAWLLLLAGLIVDVDHLLADPVYDPGRCSLGFHPLHTAPAIFVYAVLAAVPRTRIFGVGLLIHMALDGLDCLWMSWM
jgi:hypothetical protein